MKKGKNTGEAVLVGISGAQFGQVNVGITIKYPCRKIDRWSDE